MSISQKLLEFQKKNITVVKEGENPHFKSSYPTLNEVLEKVKGPLNEMNILIIQAPEKEGLRTSLIDLDDDSKVECLMPYVEATTAQKLVSNNTYNRRVSLVTLLGLQDVDDDGNDASGGKVSATGSTEPHSGIIKPKAGKLDYIPDNDPLL